MAGHSACLQKEQLGVFNYQMPSHVLALKLLPPAPQHHPLTTTLKLLFSSCKLS